MAVQAHATTAAIRRTRTFLAGPDGTGPSRAAAEGAAAELQPPVFLEGRRSVGYPDSRAGRPCLLSSQREPFAE